MKINSSYHQQRLWFIDNFEKGYLYEGSPVYHNIPLAVKINGSLTELSLIKTFTKLLADYEILRTKLILEDNKNIYQYITPNDQITLNQMVFKSENVFSKAEEYRNIPFDYENDHLIKAYYEIKDDSTDLVLIINNAIVDNYSLKKIRAYLKNGLERNDYPESESIIQYQSFSNWQNSLNQDNLEPLLFYWKAQLKDLQVLYFPTDNKREHIHVFRGNNVKIDFPKDYVLSFCAHNGGSPKLFLLTMYKMLLSKFTSLSDIVVGTIMSLRQESKNILLGPVDNLVVLRTNIRSNKDVLINYKEVIQTWEMAEKYKTMPFDKLVAEINPKKDRSRTALFDILFNYDVANEGCDQDEIQINNNNSGWGKYDLNLLVNEGSDSFTVTLNYNDLYFVKYTADAFINAYKKLIFETIKSPNFTLKEFNVLTDDQARGLLHGQQNGLLKSDKHRTIISEFQKQVVNNEDSEALVGSDFDALTYRDLDKASNQWSHLLKSKFDIQENDKVAVILPKSDLLIITLLSVLKLGATYVPVDPEYPDDRKQFISSDSKCKLTIDESFLAENISQSRKENDSFSAYDMSADSIAYIIYTSGSTGLPKGVKVSHSNVVSLLDSCYEKINVDATDTWTQFHSYCFDFSVWEIFGCFLSGGKLLMVTSQEVRDVEALCLTMNKFDATIFSQTPSSFYNFINYENLETKLRYVIFGGEMLLPHKLKDWNLKNPEVSLINMYGITETTVHVTYKEIKEADIISEVSNVGVPLSFARVYILNKEGQILPYGRIGEMYIGGHGVATGYLNRPKLDSERFLQDIIMDDEKMYRTGDKARWLTNGEIEFIGRVDRQVKIRGYRIELDEIENIISQYSKSIQQVAVETKEINQENMIVAYFVSNEEIDNSQIRSFLQNKLPEYMIPSFFLKLDSMELTSNGKVNREALPSIHREDLLKREYVAPSTQMEKTLANIWQEVLGIKQVSITDDFFELGGHSLKIIMMKSRVQVATKADLRISDFFDHPILSNLAKFIDDQLPRAVDELRVLEVLPQSEVYESSKAQKRLWFIHQFRKNKSAYNIHFTLKISGVFQMDAFQKAIDYLIDRHEIFRTTFHESNQKIKPSGKWIIDVLALNNSEIVKDSLLEIAMKPFDLEKGPLLKVTLLEETDSIRYILFNVHHIIFDDWSVSIFMKELLNLYQTFSNGGKVVLDPIKFQYKEYAHWKNRIQESKQYLLSEEYWMGQFTNLPEPLELHYDYLRPKSKTFNGNNLYLNIEKNLVERIQNRISSDGLSTVSFFLTCFKILLYKYSSQNDIVVGLPVSDRDNVELENQIGLYLNVLPIRTILNSDFTLQNLLLLVHKNLLDALNHKEYSFDELINKLSINRDVSRSPLFDVMFAHQYEDENQLDENIWNLDDVTIEQVELNPPTSKFDMLLNLIESNDSFNLRLSYNTDLFGLEKMEQILDHFISILEICSQSISTKVSQFSLLSSKEEDSLYPKKKSEDIIHIAESLNEQLHKTPDNIAIQHGTTQYSFETVHRLSDNIATNLYQEYGVRTGDRIAVLSENPIVYPLSLLAIIKLGASYLPLDSKLPKKRRDFILEEAAAKIIIVDENIQDDISAYTSIMCADLKIVPKVAINLDTMNLDDESFIIYTSGTTGIPKGIIHNYTTISNLIQWQKEQINTDNAQGYLQFSSFAFDVSVQDIAFCLSSGLTIYLPNKDEKRDLDKLYEYILAHNISLVSLPFSVLRSFITVIDSAQLDLLNLNHIITYGEQLVVSKKFVEFLKRNLSVQVHNYYGPSETHVITSNTFSGSEKIEEYQNIGKPIMNNSAYLLDDDFQLVPKGVIGTLYFSGANVFKNYVNREVSSNKHAIFKDYNDGLLYNTGDLAYWIDDNKIQYYGRKDQQIKIDGNRVEVREIEQVLGNYRKIKESVILCIKSMDNYLLHGFYVSRESFVEDEIKSYMTEYLPSYMIPQTISKIDALPMNRNGKLDKLVLATLVPRDATSYTDNNIENISKIGSELKSIWEDNLGVSISTLNSNYFELGGHSLSAMILLNRIRKRFNCEINIEDIFEYRTLSKMIQLVENSSTSLENGIPRIKKQSAYHLSPSQLSFWLKIQNQEDKEAHNIAMSFLLKGKLDILALNQALKLVIDRHEILRTVFVFIDGEPRQKILEIEDVEYEINVVQNHLPENRWEETLSLDSSFDISEWPLFNIKIIEVAQNVKTVLIEIQHLISDGWSIELFIKELLVNYNAIIYNDQIDSSPLRIQYKDYSAWIKSIVASEAYLDSEEYWKRNLSNVVYQDNFKKHRIKESTSSFDGTNYVFELNKSDSLIRCGIKNHVSLYVIVLSAIFLLKHKYSKKKDLIIAGVSAGRLNSDIEDMMGYFLNSYFLRLLVERKMSLNELFEEVKRKVVKALNHQIYPFEGMMEVINKEKRLIQGKSIYEIGITYQTSIFNKKHEIQDDNLKEIEIESFPSKVTKVKDPLWWFFTEFDEKLIVDIHYNTDIYSETVIIQLANDFEEILKKLVSKESNTSIDQLTNSENISFVEISNKAYQKLDSDF